MIYDKHCLNLYEQNHNLSISYATKNNPHSVKNSTLRHMRTEKA